MVVEKMTPDQIAEAERIVAEWKPDPASCEQNTFKGPTAHVSK